jgi:hypothetical protein
MKLLYIKKSTKPDKKLMAVFEGKNGRMRTTHFGASGMDDYTKTHDKDQRSRYRERHSKDLETNDPTKAGYLSYYILWGDSTSIAANTTAYKNKFNL